MHKVLGLDDVDMCLVGWQREGHDGPFPDHFSVDARFGGEAKMREADDCKGPDGKPRPYWLLLD